MEKTVLLIQRSDQTAGEGPQDSLPTGAAEKRTPPEASGSRARLPRSCLDDVLQLLAVSQPTDGILDGKELPAQPRMGLAWQRAAGLLFGCSGGDKL